MSSKYLVRRVSREDITVEATSKEDAIAIACNEMIDKWDCYDCSYEAEDILGENT